MFVAGTCAGAITDLQLQIYISALRQDREMGRIRHIFKVTTDDMIANVGTKLESDGTMPIGDLHSTMRAGQYTIPEQYKCNMVVVKR